MQDDSNTPSLELIQALDGDRTSAERLIKKFVESRPPEDQQTEAEYFVTQALSKVLDALTGDAKRTPDRVMEALSLRGRADNNRELDKLVETFRAFHKIPEVEYSHGLETIVLNYILADRERWLPTLRVYERDKEFEDKLREKIKESLKRIRRKHD